MLRTTILTIALLPALPAFAQQTQQQPSPEIRALNARVGMEINSNLQCATNGIALQDKLAAAEAEVKRLTDKYEPKKDN